MKKIGLTVVLLLFFIGTVSGQLYSGFHTYNEDRKEKKLPTVKSYKTYMQSGHFISSISENMESEFLQMSLFVLLTVFLYQVGSSESKKLPGERTQNEIIEDIKENEYSKKKAKEYPFVWRLYENSLTLALFSIFIFFFFFHAYGSLMLINEQKNIFGEPLITYWEVFSESKFWFESFQNWQSEFFSIAVLGLLSIFLRQKGSSQSKKMSDPLWKTGDN